MGFGILLFIGILTIAFFCIRKKLSYWKDRGVPHDEPSFFLGNLDGVGQKIHFTANIQRIYERFKIGNKLCGFYLLQSPRVILIDLELIKNVLIKDFNSFVDRGVYNNERVRQLTSFKLTIYCDAISISYSGRSAVSTFVCARR